MSTTFIMLWIFYAKIKKHKISILRKTNTEEMSPCEPWAIAFCHGVVWQSQQIWCYFLLVEGSTQTTQNSELWPCEHIQEKLVFKAEIILTPGPYEPGRQRSGLVAIPCFVCPQTFDLEEETTFSLPLGLPWSRSRVRSCWMGLLSASALRVT